MPTKKTAEMPLMVSSEAFLLLLSAVFLLSQTVETTNPPVEEAQGRSLLQKETNNLFQVARSTCQGTLYPDLCIDTLNSIQDDLTQKTIRLTISMTARHVRNKVRKSAEQCSSISRKTKDPWELMALGDSTQLLSGTIDELTATLRDLNSSSVEKKSYDVGTLLSGAMTNQLTCLDGFAHCNGKIRTRIQDDLYSISKLVSNSLAIAKKIHPEKKNLRYGRDGFPEWMSAEIGDSCR